MADFSRPELEQMLDKVPHNPMLIQSLVLSEIERTYDGTLELINPMNPFVAAMGTASTVAAYLLRQANALNIQLYPAFAQLPSDLYRWMSDRDYINRFAVPAIGTLCFIMAKDEVIANAVQVGDTRVSKLTIPRDTYITAAGNTFTLQYPVDIRIQGGEVIDVLYNAEKPSPFQSITSNQVDWQIQNYIDGFREVLQINLPLYQIKTTTYNVPLNFSRSYKQTFELTDRFFYCRVYRRTNGAWVEVKTTHSDQVFDPYDPTVLLRVDEEGLTVSVPHVYRTTGLVTDDLRIDIMTTKGRLDLELGQLGADSFRFEFVDKDKDDGGVYTGVWSKIKTISALGLNRAEGGRDSLSFEELRQRVMNNTLGPIDIPITPSQVQVKLSDLGYGIVKNQDYVTNRVFLATRRFERSDQSGLSSGLGANIGTLRATLSDLASLPEVFDNGDRVTLSPRMLYREVDGKLSIVPQSERDLLENMSAEQRVLYIADKNYLYSPLHYVFDISDGSFKSRPYYFGAPSIERKEFLDYNDSTEYDVSVERNSHTLFLQDNGWTLRLQTRSNDAFKALDDSQVFAQLKFQAVGEDGSAFINGRLVGRAQDNNEFIFEFDIRSTFDVDNNGNLILDRFNIYEPVERSFRATLTQRFGVILGASGIGEGTYIPRDIDANMGKFLLPPDAKGFYEEALTLHLGDDLALLWNRHRIVSGTVEYMTYPEDVYETYTKNQYVTDDQGRPVLFYDDQNKPYFKILHAKGDYRLDVNGNRIVAHAAGTPIVEGGEPVVKNPRGVLLQAELLLVEGLYYFVTADRDVAAANSAADVLVNWLDNDIKPLNKRGLDQTTVYFKPLSTIGSVDAIVLASQSTRIQAAQALVVTYYVTGSVYGDSDLRRQLTEFTAPIVRETFDSAVVARDTLQTRLRQAMGSNVEGVAVKGLGGAADYDIITLADDDARLVVGKKPVVDSDGKITLVDDLTVLFIRHEEES